MPLTGERAVFIDTESAGLTLEHPTIQIAAAAVRVETWEVEATFERKITFNRAAADPIALEKNSFNEALWNEQAQPEGIALRHFAAFLNTYATERKTSPRGGYILAKLGGHNVSAFDIPRLQAAYKRLGLFFPGAYTPVLDTMHGAFWHFQRLAPNKRPAAYNQLALLEYFGIEHDKKALHDALYDVLLVVQLARRLL